MPAVGGSLEEMSLNGRIFAIAADADTQRKLGGFENDVSANGDGSARIIKTRVPWSLTDIQVEIDDSRNDQEFLQSLQNLKDFFPVSITFSSGRTFQGSGLPTSEISLGNQAQTAGVSLMGPGELTQQT